MYIDVCSSVEWRTTNGVDISQNWAVVVPWLRLCIRDQNVFWFKPQLVTKLSLLDPLNTLLTFAKCCKCKRNVTHDPVGLNFFQSMQVGGLGTLMQFVTTSMWTLGW